ncbi:MAG TPA: hypothetical protein VKV26_15765 [Dehalococcoidia bacterium]|nr:hypothetical protein [Dehalococcoidia bacterium]
MTTTISETDGRLARIHETGYWRVLVHPTVFEERRIPTLRDCEKLIEAASVRLRGWDYPHVDNNGYDRGEDFIQSGSDFGNHVELWRMYQSGQFVHQFAMRGDRVPMSSESAHHRENRAPGSPHINFIDVLYTLTEILEFSKGLAYRGVLDSAGSLRIELNGTKSRMVSAPTGRMIHGRYVADQDSIGWSATQPAAILIADAPRLAVDATIRILKRFNWPEPPRALLEEEQRRFLERRL